MFFSDSTGFSSVPSTSTSSNRPTSSLSSGSMSGESALGTSSFGGGFFTPAYPFNYPRNNFSSGSSANTSVGSSPTPSDQDMSQILQQTAAMLAFGNIPDRFGVSANVGLDVAHLTGCSVTAFGPCVQDLLHSNSANSLCSVADNHSFKSRSQGHLNGKGAHRPLPPISGRKSPKADSYKTVMCQAWLETSKCNFAENCRFAHGEEELRPCKIPIKNPKYKTKLCDKYTMTGLCPYGNRCLFIHPDANGRNAYIRADRLAKMEHERSTGTAQIDDCSSQKQSSIVQTPLTSHVAARPPPSWPLESPHFFSAHREDILLPQNTNLTPSVGALKCAKKDDELFTLNLPSLCDLGITPDMTERPMALGDITNRGMASGTSLGGEGGESLEEKKADSPESGIDSDDDGACGWSVMDSDPFHFAIASDNLARHLATGFSSDWRLP